MLNLVIPRLEMEESVSVNVLTIDLFAINNFQMIPG